MDPFRWLSFYSQVRSWMGYDKAQDYKSASLLNQLLGGFKEEELPSLKGEEVAVVGAGPSLTSLRDFQGRVIIAADGASNYLQEIGLTPDIVVTDLDGIDAFPDSLYVVHAHGDNVHLLHKVSKMRRVIGTCQVDPFGRLKVLGGFTDGDRAIVIARALGAERVRLYAMDFDSPFIGKYSKPHFSEDVPVTPIKRRKLEIARRITQWALSSL